LRLVASAEAGPLEPLDRARLKLLHGEIADLRRTPEAQPLLLDAAEQLADVLLSRHADLSAPDLLPARRLSKHLAVLQMRLLLRLVVQRCGPRSTCVGAGAERAGVSESLWPWFEEVASA
jgi:hypothetical protein